MTNTLMKARDKKEKKRGGGIAFVSLYYSWHPVLLAVHHLTLRKKKGKRTREFEKEKGRVYSCVLFILEAGG